MNEDEIVDNYWKRHREWSVLADGLKSRIVRWRSATLILSAVGAVSYTLSAARHGTQDATVARVIGALALVAVPFIAKYFLAGEQVRQWLRARSVSEGLKSLVFRFRARAQPFDGGDRVLALAEAARKAETWVQELAVELASVTGDGQPAPGPLTADSYVAARVENQISQYYRINARKNARGAALFRRLELGAALAAALLGATATGLQLASGSTGAAGIGAWVAVLTTLGGGLATHAAASRYDQQARVFFATARQLEDLRDEWTARGKPADAVAWSAFVTGCEEAISAENRGWMAKLDPEEKAP